MAKTEPFDLFYEEYDGWFEKHADLYRAELEALGPLVRRFQHGPSPRGAGAVGLEIGVGSGMFAAPLGCPLGVDPSMAMAVRARARGISVALGVAEYLPVRAESLDYCLMVTTICFVDDPLGSLREAWRVLRPGGGIVVGFVDSESHLGRLYQERRGQSRFYRDAVFFSCKEVEELLEMGGFQIVRRVQAIFQHGPLDAVKEGCGEGSFVGMCGVKGPLRKEQAS